MKTWIKGLSSAVIAFALTSFCSATGPAKSVTAEPPVTPISVAVNQDVAFPSPNAVGFYLATGTNLTLQGSVDTGGYGIQGGFFGTSRVNSIPSTSAPCLYASDAGTNDIASYTLPGQQLVGTFTASQTDDGSSNGIGIAVNSTGTNCVTTKVRVTTPIKVGTINNRRLRM